MRARTWSGLWLGGVLVGLQVLGLVGPVAGQERFRVGTKDLGVAAGYSFSHDPSKTPAVAPVDGSHLLPHFGYFLTDERGPAWVRGNFEVLVEPTLIHLRSDTDSATVAGLAALGRWVLATGSWVRPYVEAGVGLVVGDPNFPQTNCDVNFGFQGGPGLLLFVSESTAVTVGYRFHHLSNAGRCSQNFGLNSSLFVLGVSHFFP